MIEYHDREWGVAVHENREHLELLVLEGAQAGLSWRTVLAKRENYRDAFSGFDPELVASMTGGDVELLLQNPGIIRHRAKIESAISNARGLLAIGEQVSSFGHYIWEFVEQHPIRNHFYSLAEVPASTELSTRISAELRRRGFRFVGPTTTYSYMQAAGLVIDHLTSCPRWKDLLD